MLNHVRPVMDSAFVRWGGFGSGFVVVVECSRDCIERSVRSFVPFPGRRGHVGHHERGAKPAPMPEGWHGERRHRYYSWVGEDILAIPGVRFTVRRQGYVSCMLKFLCNVSLGVLLFL